MKKPKIVVIGGGTGTFIVLSGLKQYPVQLSAIVSMMDSGGSTGRLTDQLGVLPPGDLRQALVALSESEVIWRKLFTYRFDHGDLQGHNFGNIFLSALQKITGSTEKSINIAMELLQTKGFVVPVTLEPTTLCANYADGAKLRGEALIDSADFPRPRITNIYLEPNVILNPFAEAKLKSADFIIFGPGDLYTSIIPNLLADGMVQAINASKAKKIYIPNVMTKVGQTDGFKISDFVKVMTNFLGKGSFDYILVNNKKPDAKIIEWYKRTASADWVVDDLGDKKYPNGKIIRQDLLSNTKFEQSVADRVRRSLIRHDSDKIAKYIMQTVWQ